MAVGLRPLVLRPLVLASIIFWLAAVAICATRNPSRELPRTSSRSWGEGRTNLRGDPSTASTNTRRQHKSNKKPNFHRDRKPNIVVVLTDDQDVELGSMNAMPKTLQVLKDGGVHFPNAYVTTPMCCPSRSSILTGMYVHNHNVFTNNENCSSPTWQHTHETRTFATYLNNAGYRTGYFGKYLNEYNGTYIPPGWREWVALTRNSRYYNYTVNLNGMTVKHADNYYEDYYPDLITNDSLSFLRQSKQYFSNKPVLLVMSYPAPHGPEDAAPQYQQMFLNNTSHRTANWNSAPNPDKQWILRHTGKMEPIHIKFTDMLHTKRLQTLQSVDEAMERLYNELKLLGELDNTYIIYLSDHGYHLGQFGLVKGKAMPFEFDVRIPFYIRGPKIPRGISIPNIVLNLDLAPTILDIAGVEIPPHMDGKSVLKLLIEANEILGSSRRLSRPNRPSELRLRKPWRDSFLIESAGRRTNGNDRMNTWREQHERQAARTMTKDQRLAALCQRLEYQSPCQLNQKWECSHDGYRWRIHKCRVHNANVRRKTNCICPEESGMNVAERNAQRAFLRDHVNKKDFKPRFINSRQKRSVDHFLDDPSQHDKELQFIRQHDPNEELQQSEFEDQEEEFDLEGVYEMYDILVALGDDHENAEEMVTKQEEFVSDIANYSQPMPLTLPRYPEDWVTARTDSDHKITERSLKKIPYLKSVDCYLVNGSVINCSDTVYQDRTAWRENKDMVDDQIKELKLKLEELKGIRKHLKDKRPWENSSKLIPTLQTSYIEEKEEGDPSESESDETSVDKELEPRKKNPQPCTCSAPFGKIPRQRSHLDELQDERRRLKEERLRHKERKLKKKAKYLNTTCNAEKMNCFTHDNNHWKTPPLWTFGPFCFCQNANNNTYWCLRTLNTTHNFLFCEFVTGFLSFYDMRTDPDQMKNVIHDIPEDILLQLHLQLMKMRECQGAKECTVQSRVSSRRGGSGNLDSDTYSSDVAAAQISKQTTRKWKNHQRLSHKRRRQNG